MTRLESSDLAPPLQQHRLKGFVLGPQAEKGRMRRVTYRVNKKLGPPFYFFKGLYKEIAEKPKNEERGRTKSWPSAPKSVNPALTVTEFVELVMRRSRDSMVTARAKYLERAGDTRMARAGFGFGVINLNYETSNVRLLNFEIAQSSPFMAVIQGVVHIAVADNNSKCSKKHSLSLNPNSARDAANNNDHMAESKSTEIAMMSQGRGLY
ncbi:hypothetical protein J6590_078871 [Homalodisca vitripennis]|nr:hypothetical protein J6590_078871 [Homalodisca vitripennis]